MNNQEPSIARLWKELAKHGIYTEEQLNMAIKKMEPLNIACMVVKQTAVEQKNIEEK